MAIGPWVLLITDALSATRYDNGNILSVLLVFLFIYCLTFVALLKNEEHGMNGLLLVTSCFVSGHCSALLVRVCLAGSCRRSFESVVLGYLLLKLNLFIL